MSDNTSYEFDSFRLIPAERQLLREGKSVALPPKAFDTLLVLVRNNGHALKKDDLISQVWPDSFVEESNLNHYISVLRKALSDGNNGDGYVETVRGYGFRFKAEVHTIPNESNSTLVLKRTRTHVVVHEEASEERKLTEIEGYTARRFRPRTLALCFIAAASVLITAWAMFPKRSNEVRETSGVTAIRSIAILPFLSIATDDNDKYLGLGITDSLITKLGKTRRVIVRPTSSIQKYTGFERDPINIGRELKVDAVLDGRIQRSGERVRVTVQLLRVTDATPLWTEDFDGNFADIFKVQDSVSVRVARAVVPNLTNEEMTLVEKRLTENAEAYQAYLRGRYLWNKRTADYSVKSAEYFRRAIELDPNFALAYVGLADAYNFFPLKRHEKEPLAKAALEKALAIDATLAEAHTTLANMNFFDDWDWPEAERRFQRAIELDPNYPTAHHWYAYYLAARGRLDEALKEIRRAQELDPLSLIINTDFGQLLHFAHRDAEATEQLRKTIELDPDFVMAHYRLAEVYVRNGMYNEAIAEFQKTGHDQGTQLGYQALLGYVYALSGNQTEARRILALIVQSPRDERSKVSKSSIALIHAGLGENDQALTWVEKALAERDVELILLKSDPRFDSIRTDPRFEALLRRMGMV